MIDGFKAEGAISIKENGHCTVKNCEVTLGRCDVLADPSTNWGLMIITADSALIQNNYVHNMRDSGNHSHNTAAIMVLASNGIVLEHNDADAGGTVFSAFGQKGGQIYNCVWRYNVARNGNCGFLGMGSTNDVNYSYDNEFYNNIILNPTDAAFILDHGTKRWDIYNNTAYNTTKFVAAGYADTSNVKMNFWNNIIASRSGGIGYYRDNGNKDWTILVNSSDYNDFYSTAFVAKWSYGSLYYTALSDWQAGTVFDGHSLSVSPGFVNAAGGDFHLSSSSPCRGAGQNGVDLGAYTYGTETIGPDYSTLGSADTIPPSAPVDLRVK